MVREIIIPKENKAQIEEVRELENTEQKKDESQGSKVIEKLEETVLPTTYASGTEKDEKQKEGAKNIIGGASAATGGVASVPLKVVGKVAEGVGKVSDEEGLEEAGKIYSEGANKPVEWIKELFE
jgi:hypothetical protein